MSQIFMLQLFKNNIIKHYKYMYTYTYIYIYKDMYIIYNNIQYYITNILI